MDGNGGFYRDDDEAGVDNFVTLQALEGDQDFIIYIRLVAIGGYSIPLG